MDRMKHKYMPINVAMSGRSCLVVGGGDVALRKVEGMLDYDTTITVVAPEVHDKLQYHAERGRITVEKREYRSPEAASYGIVISATDDRNLNRRVFEDARGAGTLVNVADDPAHCDFIVPAILRRDCLSVAISTDGEAPFMAGHLRVILDDIFPPHWERLMKLAADFRKKVRKRWAAEPHRMGGCYADFLESDWKTMLAELSDEELDAKVAELVEGEPAAGGTEEA
jgi:siroheme synthase-like protein